MAEQITATYRGEILTYSDWDKTWSWAERAYSNASIDKVAEYIDRQLKSTMKPTEAYHFSYRDIGTPEIVTATSQTDDGEWWVKTSKGKRAKVRLLHAITPENDLLIESLKQQQERIAEEEAKATEMFKSLRKLTVEDMKQPI